MAELNNNGLVTKIKDAIVADDILTAIKWAQLGGLAGWDYIDTIHSEVVTLITDINAKQILGMLPDFIVPKIVKLLTVRDIFSGVAPIVTTALVYVLFQRLNQVDDVDATGDLINLVNAIQDADAFRMCLFIRPSLLNEAGIADQMQRIATREGITLESFADDIDTAIGVWNTYLDNVVIDPPQNATDYARLIVKNLVESRDAF